MFHSEFGQDKYLDEVVFKGKRDGVFFEAGALDGILDSNTLFFERERGWTGLLVEANPESAEKCKKNRTSQVFSCGIDDHAHQAQFLRCVGGLTGWSGIDEKIEPEHRLRIKNHVKVSETVEIACMTLQEALQHAGITRVDYCVLDIEGAEYGVLQAFDWKIPIEVFEIEDNFGNYPFDRLMEDRGYKKLIRLGVSNIYQKDVEIKI